MARVRRKWTAQEDALLCSAVKSAQAESRPLLWRKLAKSVPGRTNKDCRRRWWNSLATGTAKGSWSEEEDERLIAAVRRHGTNWIRVSNDVRSRSANQCSSHWSQVLDPNINYCDWTPQEDAILLHAVLTHGTNWATIACSHRPNRTTLALRNRYSTLRLQNNNKKKASPDGSERAQEAIPPMPPTTAANSTKERDWNMDGSKCSSWNGSDRAAQSSDEDDGDDDDDEENEDDENEDDENEDDGLCQNTSRIKTAPNTQNANQKPNARSMPTPDPSPSSWDAWAARSICSTNSNPYKPQSMTADTHMQYSASLGLNSPAQYPTPMESYFYNVRDPDAMNPSLSNSLYDTSPMDMNLTPSLGPFRPSSQATMAPSAITNISGAELGPASAALADAAASKNTNSGKSPNKSPPIQDLGSQSSPLYQISLNMACTRAQLDANMILLAGMGTSVTIQIDKKS